MATITAAEKFKMIDRDVAYMRKTLPVGKMTQDFADYKISVYEAIRLDLLNAASKEEHFDERDWDAHIAEKGLDFKK